MNELAEGASRITPATAGANWQAEIDSVTPETWATRLDLFADATIYQSWAYGKISWGESHLSHLALKRDGEIVAMAQVRIVKLPVVGLGVAYVRYGPLWRRKNQATCAEIFDRVAKALVDEYAGRRKLLLRILPNIFEEDSFAAEVKVSLDRLGFGRSEDKIPYRTFRVDIRPPLTDVRKRFDGKWRNQLNRAEKNGLTIVEGTDAAKYEVFQRLYDEMFARKSFETTVDTGEFEQIQKTLPERQKMIILLAYKDEIPVSALISSADGDTGIYLLGATSNEGMQHKGSYLLQWKMIERLKERGCHYYDLGGINPETNPGVYHFKSGFSGEDVRHIGQMELSGSVMSSWTVKLGEGGRRLASRLRSGPDREKDDATDNRPVSAEDKKGAE